MKVLSQQFTVSFQYDVLFTKDLFSVENSILKDVIQKRARNFPAKVFFVIDDQVTHHHQSLIENIQKYCATHHQTLTLLGPPMIVKGGETAKNSSVFVDQILQVVNDLAIDRHAYTIAIGGGAVLDMVGYASSIAHRGIRHIRVPTTVLAQNDAGVGVKNAINAFGKKNFLGCFVPPVAVINDSRLLKTLDIRDWRAGISEAIKVALIKDRGFFDQIEEQATALVERDEQAMEYLIYECARLHLEHIASGDPFELGSSRPLDFGHWAAHKLEYLTDYELRHGEAVAIGIALDVVYSALVGMINDKDSLRIIRLIQRLGFAIYNPMLLSQQEGEYSILRGLNEFREHLGGQLTIMLLVDIGQGKEVHEMNNELILNAIHKLKELEVASIV